MHSERDDSSEITQEKGLVCARHIVSSPKRLEIVILRGLEP